MRSYVHTFYSFIEMARHVKPRSRKVLDETNKHRQIVRRVNSKNKYNNKLLILKKVQIVRVSIRYSP